MQCSHIFLEVGISPNDIINKVKVSKTQIFLAEKFLENQLEHAMQSYLENILYS